MNIIRRLDSMNDMRGYCAKCKKRDKCKKLCDICEKYVSQDYVFQSEFVVESLEESSEGINWGDVNFDNSTTLKVIILKLYFIDEKTIMDIAKMVYCDHAYISRLISKYKKLSEKYSKEKMNIYKIARDMKIPSSLVLTIENNS